MAQHIRDVELQDFVLLRLYILVDPFGEAKFSAASAHTTNPAGFG
jgi:hypothetical protein